MDLLLSDKKKYVKIIVFALPVLLALIIIFIYTFSEPFYDRILSREYERCVYAPVFFFNTILSLLISYNLYKKKLFFYFSIYLILFIALFLLSFELIHWGQLIFSYETFFFKEKSQIFHQMSISEIIKLRSYFYTNIFFVGLYGTFLWMFLYKKNVEAKYRFSKLFVPDGYLVLYFLPINALVISASFIAYISYKSRNDFNDVGLAYFENYSWLFEFINGDVHFFRVFLSLGLFFFLLRNLLWIKSVKNFRYPKLKHNVKLFFSFFIVMVVFNIFFAQIYEKYIVYNFFSANAKYYEFNKEYELAISLYNPIVKYDKNDDYVNWNLSLLYHRTGKDEYAIRYLAESILVRLQTEALNILIIEVIVHDKDDSVNYHQSFYFSKGDSFKFVLSQLNLFYQYLYVFNSVNSFKIDVTDYIYKSLFLGKNRVLIELSV